MTHSTISTLKRSAIFNDLDILAIIALGSSIKPLAPGETKVLRTWQQEAKDYGPGTLDLSLEKLTTLEEDLDSVMNLLMHIEGFVAGFGTHVPSSALNTKNTAPGVQFSEYPVEILQRTIRAIQSLL